MFSVYACGSNGKFQLGNGTNEDLNELERVFESEFEVKKIACGGNHTLLLLQNGDIFVSGDNSAGQCGIEGANNVETFTRLANGPNNEKKKWKDCSAGYEFSVLVDEDDTVYSMGSGPKGELGIAQNTIRVTSLTPISFAPSSPIVSVRSCLDHTVMLLENGDLYGWGNGRSGKIGSPAESKVWTPRLIQHNLLRIKKFDVGRDFTVIGDGDGKLELLGKDRYGIIEKIPMNIKTFKTMWSSIHAIDTLGNIISAGNNSHGQMIPDKETPFIQFSVGSEHGIIIQNKNRVICWGWGEHGNCGMKTNDSVTFDYLNEVKDFGEEQVVLIQGGCATTWVVVTHAPSHQKYI